MLYFSASFTVIDKFKRLFLWLTVVNERSDLCVVSLADKILWLVWQLQPNIFWLRVKYENFSTQILVNALDIRLMIENITRISKLNFERMKITKYNQRYNYFTLQVRATNLTTNFTVVYCTLHARACMHDKRHVLAAQRFMSAKVVTSQRPQGR